MQDHYTPGCGDWTVELLERAQPLEELGRLSLEAASGRGRLVLLGGEAGVGKTALLRHFTGMLPARVRPLWGACDALSLPRPLGPLVDVAPGLGPAFARLLDLETPRPRLFGALRDLLAASTHVLLFEDAQWADDATLDLLRYLGRSLDTTRSLVVATYRDDEVGPRHPLRVTLGDLATAVPVRRLQLEPLTPEAVRTLAAGSGLDPRELHRRTGGNPFFVTEVLAAGGTALPPTLRDVVLARAARLSAPGRRALEAAAVLGSRLDPGLLAEVDGGGGEGLEECLGSGILVREGDLIAFRHELSRDALLEAILPAQGALLHRRALAARRRAPPHPDAYATLAHHAEAARDAEAVLEMAPRAARRAAGLRSHREAGAQYERALRWADVLPPAERALLYESRSYEGFLTSDIEEALAARQLALSIWIEVGDAAKVGESHRWLSRFSWWLGRNADAERHARAALETLEAEGPGPQLAWAYANFAQIQMLDGRVREAVDWSHRAMALAEALGRRDVLCHALTNEGKARSYFETGDDGVPLMERSLAMALELDREEQAARAYTNLGAVAVHRRRLGEARRHLEAGIAYSIDGDLDSWRLYMMGWLGLCAFWEGRYAEAATLGAKALRDPRLAVPSRIQALLVLGRVHARRGDARAGAALDEAWALAVPTGELQRVGAVGAGRAEAAWLRGDLDGARAAATPAFELAVDRGGPWAIGELGFWLWRAGGLQDPPARAAEPYALQMSGQGQEAAQRWRAIGAPYEAAMALADLDDEAALREAHGTFVRLGAVPMADRVGRRLRARGRPA
jgi:tetratricopeptide (TPR) repeat protein